MGEYKPVEVQDQISVSAFEKPFMMQGVDFSLLTLREWKLLGCLADQHEAILQQRARELRFYPEYELTNQERDATLRCLTYEELRPMHQYKAMLDKAARMMTELTDEEQQDVRIFHAITVHFSEFGPRFEHLDDETVFIWTELYYRIMKRHGYLTVETPYSFLATDEKRRVLDAGSKLTPEEYLSEKELKDLRGEGGLKGQCCPKTEE